jgi:hypothetical protein
MSITACAKSALCQTEGMNNAPHIEALVKDLNAALSLAASKANARAPQVLAFTQKSEATGREFVELLWSSEDLETIRRTRAFVKAWLAKRGQPNRNRHVRYSYCGGKVVQKYNVWNTYFMTRDGSQGAWKAYQAGVCWTLS